MGPGETKVVYGRNKVFEVQKPGIETQKVGKHCATGFCTDDCLVNQRF